MSTDKNREQQISPDEKVELPKYARQVPLQTVVQVEAAQPSPHSEPGAEPSPPVRDAYSRRNRGGLHPRRWSRPKFCSSGPRRMLRCASKPKSLHRASPKMAEHFNSTAWSSESVGQLCSRPYTLRSIVSKTENVRIRTLLENFRDGSSKRKGLHPSAGEHRSRLPWRFSEARINERSGAGW